MSLTEPTFAIVAADFYGDLAERLVAGATAELSEAGAASIENFRVPGAFELPFASRELALSGRFDGIICVGAVIRGETDHYDYVCSEAARGILQVGLETGIPVGFGVLTVDSLEQALARSGGDKRDSGRHAASAVLAQLVIKRQLSA
ncbi:MAG: 6,7-dimethyl-8-ribityllumazine synthase [Solirubrobacterales bacterium]|nr:6,7-dimethyl-8-ribityllumazine synthase [Solirubrobacterales bacterium]